MGSFSDYLENELLDHIFGVGAFSAPATVYIALCTADPTDAGTGSTITEPSGGSYARVSVTNSGTNWDTASGGATANKTAFTFPTATASWGTITHFAIIDAASGGNMLMHGALTASKAVGSGDTPKFNIGAIDITLT